MITNFIVSLIMAIITFQIWHSITKMKTFYKNKRCILYILFVTILTLISFYTVLPMLRIVIMTLMFIIVYKIYFHEDLKNSIACPVITQILFLISEAIFAFVMLLVLGDKIDNFMNNYIGTIFTNATISIGAIGLCKIPIVRKLYVKFNNVISSVDEMTTIFSLCIIMFMFSLFCTYSYKNLDSRILLLFTFLIIIMAFVLLFMFFKTRDEYAKINDKYNSSLLSLKELEHVISNHRIDTHENKNHLMTIRNMTTSKKIISFVDSLLNNNLDDDNRIMKETSVIPSGGLRGLVYSKVLLMSKKNVDYELDISNSVRVVDMFDYDDYLMIDVCKIIGIFLDNAIEEVDTIDDKFIAIEMYNTDNNLVISITNSYNKDKDLSNIYSPGISTKGEYHGYGLSLVRKIVRNNKRLETYNEVTENEFTQVLIVK